MILEVRLCEEQERALPQPVLAAFDGRQGVATFALDLVHVEAGFEQRFGEQIQSLVELAAGRLQRHAQGAAPAETVDFDRQAFGAAGKVGGRVSPGSAQPHGCEEGGDPRVPGVLGEQAAEEGGPGGDDGNLRPRDHVQGAAARKLVADHIGTRVRLARPFVGTPDRRHAPIDRGADGSLVDPASLSVGHHGAHGQTVGSEILLGDAQQIVGGRGPNGLQIALLDLPAAGQVVEAAELLGQARDALPLEILHGQEVRARLLELVAAYGFAPGAFEFADGGFDCGGGALHVGLDAHREEPRVDGRVAGGIDAVGAGVALLHPADEATAVPASEDEGQQVEVGRVGVGQVDGRVGKFDAHPLERSLEDDGSKPLLERLDGSVAFGTACRQIPEMGTDLVENPFAVEVAGDHHAEVAGRVPAFEEGAHPCAVEAGDALGRAQDRCAVGVGVVRLGKDRVAEHVPGRVLTAADLFQDDLDLARDLVGIEARVECGVSQHIETHAQLRAGERCVVDGDVEGRVRVDATAGPFDLARDLADRAFFSALEEHVLVEMREACFGLALVGGAHACPDLDLGHRRDVGLTQQHPQTIGQPLEMDGKLAHGFARVAVRPVIIEA